MFDTVRSYWVTQIWYYEPYYLRVEYCYNKHDTYLTNEKILHVLNSLTYFLILF